jgi:hypothetical protein
MHKMARNIYCLYLLDDPEVIQRSDDPSRPVSVHMFCPGSLWESAENTSYSLPARLAVEHCVHEARGLDVLPATIAKFRNGGDEETAQLLESVIYPVRGQKLAGRPFVMSRDVYRVARDVCGKKTLRSPLGVYLYMGMLGPRP